MTCPVCNTNGDHRMCYFKLLETNKVKTVEEFEALCKPKTIRKGRIRARILKE